MAQENTQTMATEKTTPLTQLSDNLDSDMRAVNAVILERMQSPVALIPQLATYLIAAGGKRIRPLLTLAAAEIYGADMNNAHKLAAAVEFIHTATLLHDDVVDESSERRGQKAANLIYGNQASVLVGDFLFSRAFELMTDSNNIKALKILSHASAIITQGEVLQLTAANDINTNMDQYIEIITSKTAALFAAACEIGPVLAGKPDEQAKAMYDYGLNLGIAFQIADDTLDYMADQAKLGKTVGDDFREGKITAPILYALKKAKENNDQDEVEFWTRTIAKRDQKNGDLEHAQSLFEKHNCIGLSQDLAQHYVTKAQEALNIVPNSQSKNILFDLVPYTVSRAT